MKLNKTKKITILTTIATLMSSAVVNATSTESISSDANIADFIAVIAQVLSILCLIVFAIYMGRFVTIKTDDDKSNGEKLIPGVRNALMTSLVGIAICQATIIVVQQCF